MKQLFYSFIYSPFINRIIRNVNRVFLKRFVSIPPSGKIRFDSASGPFYIHTNQTNYITSVLYYHGWNNYEYAAIFATLIKKCKVFFDIGANTGFYTVLGCKLNPELRVVCFEPAIGSLYYLKKSCRSNGLTERVSIEPVALANQSGKIEFHDVVNRKYPQLEYNLAGESSTSEIYSTRPFKKYLVDSITLDEYITRNTPERIDLIKIDTEGTEDTILSKSVETLKKYKPIVICETLFGKIETELQSIMSGLGYHFYNHYSDGLRRVPHIVRNSDDGVRNCFFVHPEKEHLIREFVVGANTKLEAATKS